LPHLRRSRAKPWIVAKRTPDLLILGKPGEFESEVFSVQALVTGFRHSHLPTPYCNTSRRRNSAIWTPAFPHP
jgi:hypothetical protein